MPVWVSLTETALTGALTSDQSDEKACGSDTSSQHLASMDGAARKLGMFGIRQGGTAIATKENASIEPTGSGRRTTEVPYARDIPGSSGSDR